MIEVKWEGGVFKPLQPVAFQEATYFIELHRRRSMRLHRTYFRALKIAYDNLPDTIKEKFTSLEHFRKRLLIMCDYCEIHNFVEPDKDKAIKLALFLKSVSQPYDVIRIEEGVVVLKRPNSQRVKPVTADDKDKGMDSLTFKQSAQDVLTKAAHLIGVGLDELMDMAKS